MGFTHFWLATVFGILLSGGRKLEIPKNGAAAHVGGVVLELKFTDRYPRWMYDLAQTFNLQRVSVPKYVLCVEALKIARRGWVRKPP